MSNKQWILILIVMVTVVFAAFTISMVINKPQAVGAAASTESKSTISVDGEYDIKIPANVAYIEIGVETKDVDVKVAQEQNATDINNVIEAVKELGLKDDDITTSNYSIYPSYDYSKNDGNAQVEYYTVSNMVRLKVVDLDILGNVIDLATEAGANRAYNIYFDADDTQDTQNEALQMAIKDALDRADIIADAAGVKVAGIHQIVDQSYNSAGYYGAYNNMDMAYARSDEAVSTSIMSGDVTISANVHILVEIMD